MDKRKRKPPPKERDMAACFDRRTAGWSCWAATCRISTAHHPRRRCNRSSSSKGREVRAVQNQLVMWLTLPPPLRGLVGGAVKKPDHHHHQHHLAILWLGLAGSLPWQQFHKRLERARFYTTNKIKQKLKAMRTANATDLGYSSARKVECFRKRLSS